MAFETRPESNKRVSWAAVWKSGNRGRRRRNCKGTEVEEDLTTSDPARNSRKTTRAGSAFMQESIVKSEIREVKVVRLFRAW